VADSHLIRLGISRCLLGDHVRYDGGHKRDRYLTDVLSRSVEWVPVCPEMEAGLGVPREPMRLVGKVSASRLVTISTRHDRTELLKYFSSRKIRELRALDLSGFVFKARSPSCGLEGVPLYDRRGGARPAGIGLFAKAFQKAFPQVPVADEGRLTDPAFREQFLNRVYQYHDRKKRVKKPLPHASVQQRKTAGTRRRKGKP
jgi:uncharacterized protein YbbK (DUF523 family)